MARPNSRFSPKWPTTHPSMLEAAKGKDESARKKAWGDFCRDRWKPLLSYASKFDLSKQDAEDIVQELLADGLKLLASYNPANCMLRHFLMTCLKNRILNKKRDEAARPDHKAKRFRYQEDTRTIDRALEDHRGGDPDQEFDREWRVDLFEKSVQAVEEWQSRKHPDYIPILHERVLTEPEKRKPAKEYADSLGITVPVLEKRASRLRQDILEEIERQVRREHPEDADVREEVRNAYRAGLAAHVRRRRDAERTGK